MPPEQSISDMVRSYLADAQDMSPNVAEGVSKQVEEWGLPVHLYGIDRFTYDKLEFVGEKPTWEKYSTGNYLLTSTAKFSGDIQPAMFDADATVTLKDRDGNNKTYKVLAVVEVPRPTTPMHGHGVDIDMLLPSDSYQAYFLQDSLIYLHLKADEVAIPALEKTIAAYCESRTVDYISRATYMTEFEGIQGTYLLVGGALGGILGLVGILNFVNSMLTAIFIRRTELAMLQSVGMTTSQLRKMLVGEGLWYIALTAAITLSLGNLLSAFITNAIAGQTWFFSYHFTMTPMLIVLPLLLIPAVLIPLVTYRSVSRQSVVERLREI